MHHDLVRGRRKRSKLVPTMRFGVFAEATLAFLGFGAGDAIGWGAMLNLAFRDPLLPTIVIATLILTTVRVRSGVTGPRRSGQRRNSRRSIILRPRLA